MASKSDQNRVDPHQLTLECTRYDCLGVGGVAPYHSSASRSWQEPDDAGARDPQAKNVKNEQCGPLLLTVDGGFDSFDRL